MNIFKPALLLIRYSWRQGLKSKTALFMGFTVPLAYTAVFVGQIVINYKINARAFNNLPISYYFTALFTSQAIVFTAWERSPRELARMVLSSEIDLLLLRPINLFYFKYFRYLEVMVPLMAAFYIIGIITSFSFTHLPLYLLGYIFIIIICGTLIKLNLRSSIRGLVFFYRDILNTTRLEESLDLLSQNKPPEIFPGHMKLLLTILLPIMLYNNSTYDLLRHLDTPVFWFLLFFWTVFAIFLNKFTWSYGLRKYESMG